MAPPAPLVSVVMPVHDGEAFVGEAIRSILGQSMADFELVVVDDGSKDRSRDIITGFGDPRIVLLEQKENVGIARALNIGLAGARGTYVARMDADDLADPDRLAAQTTFLDAHPDIGIVGSDVILIDGAGAEIGRVRFPEHHEEISRTIMVHNPFAHGSVMLRRRLLDAWGTYDPRFLDNEDYDLWMRLHAAGVRMANVPRFLLLRRIHETSITVAHERRLVGGRFKTIAHAVFAYYHRPVLAVHLARPAAAYVYRLLR